MKIVIFGANGFLGKAVARFYKEKGAEVHVVLRNEFDISGTTVHHWDGKNFGDWTSALEDADVVINLAGKSVDCRYTHENKEKIYSSRIDSTKIIGMAIQKCTHPPKLWLNSSSATIYRHASDHPQDEPNGELGNDFSPDVCKKWEAELFKAEASHTLRYALRTAIVFGDVGGVLPVLKKLVKFGLGGKQGSGLQKVSWIHIHDFLRALDFIITHKLPEGIYNVCSPNPTDNQTLMKYLREQLHIPFGLNASKWMLEIGAFVLRTETELVLKSRWVIPTKLLNAGYVFEKSNLNDI